MTGKNGELISGEKKPIRRVAGKNSYVDASPFWSGLEEGKLVVQYCTVSNRFQYYPRPISVNTGRKTIEWRETKGIGYIYAFTVVRVPGPNVTGRIPLCVATVELEEGFRMMVNVLNCQPEDLAIGAKVKFVLDRLDEDQPYPAFELI